jgi:ParB family transcriptional regulator, chromosome partitioning protein
MTEVSTAPGNRRLGRGLSALLGGGVPAHEERDELPGNVELRHIPVERISRNPFQPRKQFDPESLGELASSIKEHGVLQPLIVREIEGGYQLIAGERRWQAARKAGLTSVPCRIVDVIDKTACEFALEENLKRKDLNDLEKAQAFRDYLDQFECTLEELSKQISMSRSAVSNMLRLLELPDPVKNALHAGRISAGHARTLLPLEEADQLALCGRIQAETLSVRRTEALVRELLNRKPADDGTPLDEAGSADEAAADTVQEEHTETLPLVDERTNHVNSLEEQLRDLLGVKVQIKLTGKETGQIVIPFASNSEFERILKTVRRSAA